MKEAPIWISNVNQRKLTRFGELPTFKEGLYKIASHSYAWMVPNGSWGETNIGLVECNGESVLIDTCWDLNFTQQMLQSSDDILKRSPIEYIINTHADGDHCWGNQFFSEKAIIGTEACVSEINHLKPGSLNLSKRCGCVIRNMPFTQLKQLGHYLYEMAAPYDFSKVKITAPNIQFSDEKVLNVKGIDFLIKEVGPGHTKGDAIVYVPSQKVVYAADILFVKSTPVAWSGPIGNIVESLQYLLSLDANVIVPGHGPMGTRKDVENLINYWDFIQTELHKRYQKSMSPFEAAIDVVASIDYKKQAFGDWDSPERIVTNATTLYKEWGFRSVPMPEKVKLLNIMRHQANLAFSLPNASPAVMHNLRKKSHKS